MGWYSDIKDWFTPPPPPPPQGAATGPPAPPPPPPTWDYSQYAQPPPSGGGGGAGAPPPAAPPAPPAGQPPQGGFMGPPEPTQMDIIQPGQAQPPQAPPSNIELVLGAAAATGPIGAIGRAGVIGSAAYVAAIRTAIAGGGTIGVRTILSQGRANIKNIADPVKRQAELKMSQLYSKILQSIDKILKPAPIKGATEAAAGKVPPGTWQIDLAGGGWKIPTNTKTAALTNSYLSKVAAQFKNPRMAISLMKGAFGLISASAFMSIWGHLEAVDTLAFSYRTAKGLGTEEGDALAEVINETLEPLRDKDFWNIVGRPIANLKEMAAAKIIGAGKMMDAADLKAEKAGGKAAETMLETKDIGGGITIGHIAPPYDPEAPTGTVSQLPLKEGDPGYWEDYQKRKRKQEIEDKLADKRYYELRDFEKAEADKLMRKFWEDYQAKKNASDEANRKFWADYQANKQKYWEEYQRKKKEEAPSKLGFGLL